MLTQPDVTVAGQDPCRVQLELLLNLNMQYAVGVKQAWHLLRDAGLYAERHVQHQHQYRLPYALGLGSLDLDSPGLFPAPMRPCCCCCCWCQHKGPNTIMKRACHHTQLLRGSERAPTPLTSSGWRSLC